MIRTLKFISLSLFLLACIVVVNAWQPPQKPQPLGPKGDSSVQTTLEYLSTKLRDGIFPDRVRRDARYGQNIPPAGHHMPVLDRRQSSNSTTTSATSKSNTAPSTSHTSSLPSQTSTTQTTESSSAASNTQVSTSMTLIPTTLPDGSLSTFTSFVIVHPTRTASVTGNPSSTSKSPSLQNGAVSATMGLQKQMFAMLGGAVVVAMAL